MERAGDYQSIKCGPHQPADKDGRRKRRCQFGAALLFDDKDYQETGKGSRLKKRIFHGQADRKGRVTLPNQINFRKSSKEGGSF